MALSEFSTSSSSLLGQVSGVIKAEHATALALMPLVRLPSGSEVQMFAALGVMT